MASSSAQTVRIPEPKPSETPSRSAPLPAPRPATKPFTIKIQGSIPF